jgi:hypothetical protein
MSHVPAKARALWDSVGGLSDVTKMPGYSWGISARRCQTGAKLARIPGTVCSKCYALKGNYVFASVARAHARRLAKYNANPGAWTRNMADLIRALDCRHFRFFDAGDLQSTEMLSCILEIARACPRVRFWIATREVFHVRAFISSGGIIPENTVVRISAPRIDQHLTLIDSNLAAPGIALSAVHSHGLPLFPIPSEGYKTCPAPTQGGKCGECRACWKRSTRVAYTQH